MVDNGIKPVYVFDGKPPDMKGGELTKRAEKREEASKQLALATDAGKPFPSHFLPHTSQKLVHFQGTLLRWIS